MHSASLAEQQRTTVPFCFLLLRISSCPNTGLIMWTPTPATCPLNIKLQPGSFFRGAILKTWYLAKVFSMLASAGEDTSCVSHRVDMNLTSGAPPVSPQLRHCGRCLNASKPLLLSATLSILWVCFLLYLLTVLHKPRRSAEAAIFPALTP